MRFTVCWILAGLADFLFLRDFFRPSLDEMNALRPLLFHLSGSLLLLFSTSKGRIYSMLTFFMPGFGWLLSLILFVCDWFSQHHQVKEASGYEFELVMQEKPKILLKTKGNYRERILSELDFVPLIDILKGQTDPELKRGAIEKLAELKTPEAVDILLSLRSDPSLEIRFYATSSITRIKKGFDEQLEAAKQEMKKDVYKTSARLFLAKTYLRYTRSHLLDEITTAAYEKEALFHLNACSDSEYVRDENFWLLYEVYSAQNHWDKALETMDRLEKREKADVIAIDQARIEIFYRMGQYEKIPEIFSKITKEGTLNSLWSATANWWGMYSL